MNYLIVVFCCYVSFFSGYCEDKHSKKNDDGVQKAASFEPYTTKKEYTMVEEKKTWIGALLGCRRLGLILASVESEAEQYQLTSYLKKKTKGGRMYWLGGSELEGQNAQYNWESTGQPLDYHSWAPKQPDHGPNQFGQLEQCLTFTGNPHKISSENWHNYNCNSTFYYICQNLDCTDKKDEVFGRSNNG